MYRAITIILVFWASDAWPDASWFEQTWTLDSQTTATANPDIPDTVWSTEESQNFKITISNGVISSVTKSGKKDAAYSYSAISETEIQVYTQSGNQFLVKRNEIGFCLVVDDVGKNREGITGIVNVCFK